MSQVSIVSGLHLYPKFTIISSFMSLRTWSQHAWSPFATNSAFQPASSSLSLFMGKLMISEFMFAVLTPSLVYFCSLSLPAANHAKLSLNYWSRECIIRPGQVDSQFIVSDIENHIRAGGYFSYLITLYWRKLFMVLLNHEKETWGCSDDWGPTQRKLKACTWAKYLCI